MLSEMVIALFWQNPWNCGEGYRASGDEGIHISPTFSPLSQMEVTQTEAEQQVHKAKSTYRAPLLGNPHKTRPPTQFLYKAIHLNLLTGSNSDLSMSCAKSEWLPGGWGMGFMGSTHPCHPFSPLHGLGYNTSVRLVVHRRTLAGCVFTFAMAATNSLVLYLYHSSPI